MNLNFHLIGLAGATHADRLSVDGLAVHADGDLALLTAGQILHVDLEGVAAESSVRPSKAGFTPRIAWEMA